MKSKQESKKREMYNVPNTVHRSLCFWTSVTNTWNRNMFPSGQFVGVF